MEQLQKKTPRIEVVDALRGFAVMAILLVHNMEHFIYPVYPADSPAWLNVLDKGVLDLIFSLFAGKAYAIFALLFGFTFYIQSENQRRRGKDFGYRFLWRMVLLVVFATVNAAFFPAGDVLLLFVVVSLVLFVVRNWGNRAILITAVFFLLQPVEWYHYVMSLFNPAYQLPDLNVGAMYDEVAECTARGHFGEFIWKNMLLGQKASLLWAVNAGRFFQTAGLFLMGLYLGRSQMFVSSESNMRRWITILAVAAVSFAPLYMWKEQAAGGGAIVAQTVGTAFDMWQKLAFTFVMVSSFIFLYHKGVFGKIASYMRFYGRMSLTNYISQSVIGAFIYFPFGLNLAGYCGYTLSLFIAIVTLVLQVWFCKWWLTSHKQGPLEYIWHKWTWIGSGSK